MKTFWQYSWKRTFALGLLMLPLWMLLATDKGDAFMIAIIAAVVIQLIVANRAGKRLGMLKNHYNPTDYTTDQDLVQMYVDKIFGWFVLTEGVLIWAYYLLFSQIKIDGIGGMSVIVTIWVAVLAGLAIYQYGKYRRYHSDSDGL